MIKLGLKDLNVWPIGKHKGKRISKLPLNYLSWVVLNSSLDNYLIKVAEKEIERRGFSIDELMDYNPTDNGLDPFDPMFF